ncbi:MAG TPA: Crp/Fnr family transcriptional regulator [Ignavibacteriaceae bacterium]
MIPEEYDAGNLASTLKSQAGLTNEETELFLSFLSLKKLHKKEHYLNAGDICNAVAYVNKGCLRRYIIDEHLKESIIYFALEDYFICDLESLMLKEPTVYYIQALEDCELLLLSRENLSRVYDLIPKFKEFHDYKMKRNHYYTIKRLTFAKSATPEEKYLLLMKDQPQLFQRIPMHFIASYLGIEPESLSRLRKRLTIKPHNS